MQSISNTESIALHTNLNGSSVTQRARHRLSEDNSEIKSLQTGHQDPTREQDEEESDHVKRAWKRPHLPGTRTLFTKNHQIKARSSIDVFAKTNKQTRGRIKNYNCFRCGSTYHRHLQCSTPITHPGGDQPIRKIRQVLAGTGRSWRIMQWIHRQSSGKGSKCCRR